MSRLSEQFAGSAGDGATRIKGLRELNESLRIMGERFAPQVMRSAMLAGAAVVARAARKLAVQRTNSKRLPKGIVWRALPARVHPSAAGVFFNQKKKGKAPTVYFAHLLEFGTKNRWTRKRGRWFRGRVTPRNFVSDAFQQSRGEAMNAMVRKAQQRIVMSVRAAKNRVGRIADDIEANI